MDKALEIIDQAYKDGIDVGVDAYLYLAGSCGLTQFLPTWTLEGGSEELIGRLKQPQKRREIAEQTEAERINTWKDVVVENILGDKYLIGKNIQDISDL